MLLVVSQAVLRLSINTLFMNETGIWQQEVLILEEVLLWIWQQIFIVWNTNQNLYNPNWRLEMKFYLTYYLPFLFFFLFYFAQKAYIEESN